MTLNVGKKLCAINFARTIIANDISGEKKKSEKLIIRDKIPIDSRKHYHTYAL